MHKLVNELGEAQPTARWPRVRRTPQASAGEELPRAARWFAGRVDGRPGTAVNGRQRFDSTQPFQDRTAFIRCTRALTFDMRGGRQLAKPDVARPLDGRVRRIPSHTQ